MIIEIQNNKQRIFEKVYELGFKDKNTVYNPDMVFIQLNNNGEPEVMYTGFEHDKYTFYDQHNCRIRKTMHGKELLDEFCEYIKNRGYKYHMGLILNENMPALIRALKSGFRVIGTKTVERNVLLEVCKRN